MHVGECKTPHSAPNVTMPPRSCGKCACNHAAGSDDAATSSGGLLDRANASAEAHGLHDCGWSAVRWPRAVPYDLEDHATVIVLSDDDNNVPAEGGAWSCEACTCENQASTSACVVCGGPKDGTSAGVEAMQARIVQRAKERAKNRAQKQLRIKRPRLAEGT